MTNTIYIATLAIAFLWVLLFFFMRRQPQKKLDRDGADSGKKGSGEGQVGPQ